MLGVSGVAEQHETQSFLRTLGKRWMDDPTRGEGCSTAHAAHIYKAAHQVRVRGGDDPNEEYLSSTTEQ